MAHLHSLAPPLASPPKPNYASSRLLPAHPTKFPPTPVFSSMNAPSRFEASLLDLEITGTLPPSLSGTFFRIQPDARFPPLFADDIHFNGDGAVTAIRLHDGHADLLHRYVHTDRYVAETAARRALFGRYRNPFTDDEGVRGVVRTASNTNVVFWRGMLLAMKEDGPPFAMDPETLETVGRYDFEGQLGVPTVAAHPKVDPRTGEMVCFAYECGGDGADGSKEVAVWTVEGEGGRVVEMGWYAAPFAGMIHDAGVSENWVVLPLTPLKVDVERMRRGGNKFAWDPEEDQWYGVVPRRGGKREDIVWFRADNGFHGHVAGCYELPTGEVVLDLTVADGNVFFFFPPDNKDMPSDGMEKRNKLNSPTMRWIFDPKAKKTATEYPHGTVYVADERVTPAVQWRTNGEFSRIDDRYVTKPYRHFWQAVVDPTKPYDFAKCGPPAGGLFNCLGHYTWSDEHFHDGSNSSSEVNQDGEKPKFGSEDVFFFSSTTTFQEPTFIPKEGGGEGEGYLIALLNHLDQLRNDIVVFDAQNLSQGPLAIIHLPFKLKLGLHGNWVDNREIEAWKNRRAEGGDLGPVQAAKEMLPWQKAFIAKRESEKVPKQGDEGQVV